MTTPNSLPPGKTPREYYGSELRRLREAALPKMSQEKLGALTFVSGTYIGQLENSVRSPQIDLSLRIDDILDSGGVLVRIHELLEYSRFADYFKEAVEHESRAVSICEYAGSVVPGLLQTSDYATAVSLGAQPLLSDDELAELVAARMDRQRLVSATTGPELWFILDEAVLRRVVGSRRIIVDQLRHIAALIIRRRLIVQIVAYEAGAHALLGGMLSLMTFSDAPPLVYLEGQHAGQLIDDTGLVARCQRSYDLVRAAALSPEASLALILSAAEVHENAQEQ
ncbi:helix-turn-helix domain-containing protein [Streptomyces sp. BE303]|uniref:helix-turn-helix domain-containing protein n=1 Tax=Streptomyces sp. BE303 TaxID=3002528 RepID=UPI002E79B328|nr:helix-turn-helix transcriptional regulator [Streptomyces sp. BE303]MED7948002.1 helix-turn-helix transcriptional regulator [Streptomyces sp. BE303]